MADTGHLVQRAVRQINWDIPFAMKTLKKSALLLMLIIPAAIKAQPKHECSLTFQAVFNDIRVKPGDFCKLASGDSISFETLKFYLSGIEFLRNDTAVWKEQNSFHLVNLFETENENARIKLPSDCMFNKIRFQLGIDSITNVSGAMGGDLDPTKGMFWTWQSGYINFKLEGKSNVCKTRNNEFQFHLGGYRFPFNSMQAITQDCMPEQNIFIRFDLENFIHQFDLSVINQVMMPGEEAYKLAMAAAASFQVMK